MYGRSSLDEHDEDFELSDELETPEPEGVRWSPSPYHRSRGRHAVSGVILHYTADGTLESTERQFINNPSSVSAHYVVGKYGDVVQMVDLNEAAYHAGKNSSLPGCSAVNSCTVGIEIVNWGPLRRVNGDFQTHNGRTYSGLPPLYLPHAHPPHWEPFTSQQYDSVAYLLNHLLDRFPTIRYITGHEHVAPGYKIDPGPGFDWDYLRALVRPDYDGQFGPLERPAEGIKEDRAVRLNRRYAQSLGWGKYIDQIAGLLGFEDMTPDELTLARAIARWQSAHNLSIDGILGPMTWRSMQNPA